MALRAAGFCLCVGLQHKKGGGVWDSASYRNSPSTPACSKVHRGHSQGAGTGLLLSVNLYSRVWMGLAVGARGSLLLDSTAAASCPLSGLSATVRTPGLEAAARAAVLGASIASWLGCSLRSGDSKSRISGGGHVHAGLVTETGDDLAGDVRPARNPLGSMNGGAAFVLPAAINSSAMLQAACIVRPTRSSGAWKNDHGFPILLAELWHICVWKRECTLSQSEGMRASALGNRREFDRSIVRCSVRRL